MSSTRHTPVHFYLRTLFETAGLILAGLPVSWLIYTVALSPIERQMVADELEPAYRPVMFLFSMVVLTVLGILFAVLYYKNGDRRRAYLAATSVSDAGESAAAEGHLHYRKAPLIETAIATGITAVLWLPEIVIYSTSQATSGAGFGYQYALPIEDLYISVVGLCQPFRNAWVGFAVGLVYLAAFQYAARRISHRRWESDRIRP